MVWRKGAAMAFKDFFGGKSEGGKPTSKLRLFQTEYDFRKTIKALDPDLQFFAESFYGKFLAILPENSSLQPDPNAPEDARGKVLDPKFPPTRLSLEHHQTNGVQSHKYGTGRVELRERFFFAKTVTWRTPKNFLHQIPVYQMIKLYFSDSNILPTRSRSANGFALKSKKHVITLEVFGEHPEHGFLACDLTLDAHNKPLAKERMEFFMDFYGALYNLLDNPELAFRVAALDAGAPNVEFVEDYQSQLENQTEDNNQNDPT